jgi:ArsR family transcriptional regulator
MSSVERELYQLHASVCKGLADPKRLLILYALRHGELSVSDLCEEVGFAQANVSQHLAVLRDKGLVHARKDGQFVFYSVSSPKIIEALELLRQVMTEQVVTPAG